jgi:hypothetical protein
LDPSAPFRFCLGVKKGRPRKNVQTSKRTLKLDVQNLAAFCKVAQIDALGKELCASHLRINNATIRMKQIDQKAFDLMD